MLSCAFQTGHLWGCLCQKPVGWQISGSDPEAITKKHWHKKTCRGSLLIYPRGRICSATTLVVVLVCAQLKAEWEHLFSKVNAEEEGVCVRGCSAHGEGHLACRQLLERICAGNKWGSQGSTMQEAPRWNLPCGWGRRGEQGKPCLFEVWGSEPVRPRLYDDW